MSRKLSPISRNPNVMSGSYCIRGTRISVTWIKGRHRGGDSAMKIATDYGLPVRDIRAALRFMERVRTKETK